MKPLFFLSAFLFGIAVPRSDAPALTLKDAVEVVAEFTIHHPLVPDQTDWYGVTDYDGKKIFIIQNASLASRRKTAIHEMLHAARHFKGQVIEDHAAEELVIRAQADALYKELFGQ